MKKFNLQALKAIVLDFPLVILSSILGFLYIFVLLEFENYVIYDSLGIVLSAAIPLFYGLNIMSRQIGNKWSLRFIGIALLLLYFAILPKYSFDFKDNLQFIVFPIFILLHLFVSVAINFKNQENQVDFWRYNKNLFINFITALIFSGVLIAGVLSIILTCEKLFELNLNDKLYLEVYWFIQIVGNTFIFLLFDYKTNYQDKEEEFPVVLKFFTQYVLIPIMFLYTIVLYLYSLKILINWELPEGWLSYGILSYSIVGILALLLVYPLREESKKSWVRWFYKLFFYSVIPLIILLFIAIFTRLLDYGFTELRYYVLALAIWLSICTIYFNLYKKASISFIPKSLILTIIFALICPYFNVFSVSIRSQKQEIRKILTENNLLTDGKIDYSAPVNKVTIDEINSKYRFLKERGEDNELMQYVDSEKIKEINKEYNRRFLNIADFDTVIYEDAEGRIESSYSSIRSIRSNNDLILISEGVYIWTPQKYNLDSLKLNSDYLKIIDNNNEFKIILNDKEEFDLLPLIKAYSEKTLFNITEFESDINVDDIYFDGKIGKYTLRIYLDRISSYDNLQSYNNVIKCLVIRENK